MTEDVTLSSTEASSSDALAVTPQLTDVEAVAPKKTSSLRAEAIPFDPRQRVTGSTDVEASEAWQSDSKGSFLAFILCDTVLMGVQLLCPQQALRLKQQNLACARRHRPQQFWIRST